MRLTTKQQIEVLESVLKGIMSPTPEWGGLCIFILYELSKRRYTDYLKTRFDEIRLFIPLFTIENAARFGAGTYVLAYWWPLQDMKSRARFVKWIIKQLKK